MVIARRQLARLSVAAVLVALAVGYLAQPAFAHAELRGTTPGQGETVKVSPPSVSLTFSEQVEANLGAIRIFDGRGTRVDDGRIERFAGGTGVRTRLDPLSDGNYVVTWRVVSADSHAVAGAFTFNVGTPSVAVDESLVKRLFGAQGDDSAVAVIFGITRIVEFLALAVFVGSLLVLAGAWPAGWALRRVRRMLVASGVVGLFASVLSVPLQGAKAAGFGLGDAFGGNLIRDVLYTRYGTAVLVRVFAITAALIAMFLPAAVRRWCAPAAGVVGLATLSFAGHASVASPALLAVSIDALHLLAGAYWVGGLSLLLFVVLRGTPKLPDQGAVIVRITRGFLYAVFAVVVTGVIAAWREVGSFAALTATDYGALLLGKVSAFFVMLLLAVYGRNLVLLRWVYEYEDVDVEEKDGGGEGAGEGDDELDLRRRGTEADDVKHLRRSVGIEVLFAVAVFTLTGLLVASVPAKQAYDSRKPFQQSVTSDDGKYVFDLSVDPAHIGRNDVHITLTRSDGALASVLAMTGEMDLPNRDIAPIDLELRRLGSAHYFSPGFSIPLAGEWRITVRARLDQFTETSVATKIAIR